MTRLINHPPTQLCPVPECPVCSIIDCEYDDRMHYDDDGCPSCTSREAEIAQLLDKRLAGLNTFSPAGASHCSIRLARALMCIPGRYRDRVLVELP